MSFQSHTAPGTYVQVVNVSQDASVSSRYLPGMVGVAEKGPFDVPVQITSFSEFVANFGKTIPNNYLALAASIVGNLSDGLTIVRVGNHYASTASAASGTVGDSKVYTPQARLFAANDYVRISQAGKATTVNGRVLNVFSNATPPYFTIVNTGTDAVTLADNYSSADVDVSAAANASSPAEGFLSSYQYTTALKTTGNVALTVDGNKNGYEIQVTANGASVDPTTYIFPGDLLKITQTGRATTREILVLSVSVDGTVTFQTSNRSDIGYQALALQDSYVSNSATPPAIYKVVLDQNGFPELVANTVYVTASSDGTWANSSGPTDGVVVQVAPGSTSDTKNFLVYLDGALVETIPGLTFTDPTAASYASTQINGNSVNLSIVVNSNTEPPANTRLPWNLTVANTLNQTGLVNGFNGENASVDDFIGTLDPSTGTNTGLQIFDDTEYVNVNQIIVPGRSDTAILQEMAIIAADTNVLALGDVPLGLTATEAIDWHNGVGIYKGQGRINSPYLAVYWNWFQTVDPFTGTLVWCPPTVGAARAFAVTFDQYYPWYAAAGDKRGLIPEAEALQFTRVPQAIRDAMYGNGNSVNPILSRNGNIEVFGERTMAVQESKLSVCHTINLLNYIVTNFGILGNQFTFEPNDPTLLSQIFSAGNTLMKSVMNARGVEGYSLVCDSSNNTAATRNLREAIVSLSVIPTDTMERLLCTIVVNNSGATLAPSSSS